MEKKITILVIVAMAATVVSSFLIGYIASPKTTVTENGIIENTGPSFPFGSTYNQVIAWNCLIARLHDADVSLGWDYIDGYVSILHYQIGHAYIRSLMLKLIGDMGVIRGSATPEWGASIDKLIEVAEWSIKGIDNYALYLETGMESYFNLYETCWQNAVSAGDEAWNLMPA